MATFTWTAQLTDASTLTVGGTDQFWPDGANFGDKIIANEYQDSTHIVNSTDVEQCSLAHVNNTKRLTGTTVSLNGGASQNLSTLSNGDAPLKINFSDASSVETSSTAFAASNFTWSYFYAAEIGDSSWTDAHWINLNKLLLSDQASSTSHDYYIAFSVSPNSTGTQSDNLRFELTYV